nr:calcofluor white hypersensitive protein [Kwoniella mangroviensis CBS 8507]OCF64771.1 calcofluor white hypersensitive protein [Kwoniella mangroviensis CBS 8507]
MSTLLAFPAGWIPKAHTFIAYTAFSTALSVGWISGLWKEICINSVAKWPVEWFPSVSATIGDHAPPRAPFQILIALCATPRFLLLLVQWLVHRYPPSRPPKSSERYPLDSDLTSAGHSSAIKAAGIKTRSAAAKIEKEVEEETLRPVEEALRDEIGSKTLVDIEVFVGIARTFCCGGWVYITSRDHHDIHDLFMILYLLLTLPWMFFSTQNCSNTKTRSTRRVPFFGFLAMIPPLIWFYYEHSVMRIPGAYTYYSMFEWSLVVWDVGFDALAVLELSHLQIAIVDTTSSSSTKHVATSNGHSTFYMPKIRTATHTKLDKDAKVDWTAELPTPSPRWRQALAFASDVYWAICFWTVFTSLGLQLFYWSIWKLALAGSELALLANLSGFTFSMRNTYEFCTSKQGLLTHRIMTVVFGMGFYIFPWPIVRLVGIFIGVWTGWQVLFATWERLKGSEEIVAEGQILGLGLVITWLIKYINNSTNPLWAISHPASGGWNKTGLILAALAIYEYYQRPVDLHPAPPLNWHIRKESQPYTLTKTTKWQRLSITVGFGALIHLIQTFVTDSGTIISWTWTGYPVKGPTLHPFAGIVIAVASLGILHQSRKFHYHLTVLGLIGAIALYRYPDWIGYIGGLLLVFYLQAIFPSYIRVLSVFEPGPTYGYALVTNIILDVISVVTAAYAFVPLGWIFRERTDLVLGFCMVVTVLGWWSTRNIKLPSISKIPPRAQRRIRSTKRYTIISSVLLSIVSIGYSYSKMPRGKPVPYYPDHKIFSGGIWTVHFGLDKEGRDSQWRMMQLIKEMQVDVLGLLESDLHRFVYGNRDLTRVISEELGYYVDLGPGPNKHTWGAALLSKYPILNSTHHLLPSPHGELAPAIHATLDVHGQRVNVMVSHNGQVEEDALDRELQTTEIARLLRETSDAPTVFLGYLVTRPGDFRPWPYQILMEDGQMWDIEIEDRRRWCEYIAFRGLWRIGFARVHESDISDTELQVGKFMLPKPGHPVHYESNKEMYWHIGESDIPEPWHMPSMFRGNGTRGHRYVVWDGPLYYLPPERSGLQRYSQGWTIEP